MTAEMLRNPTWWKQRSALERGLILIAVCEIILSFALALGLGVVTLSSLCKSTDDDMVRSVRFKRGILQNFSTPIISEEEICQKEECIHTASRILNNMDQSVEPCDDFYEFACGKFLESTNIPADQTSVNSFAIVGSKLVEQLRNSIEEPSDPKEPKPFSLAKNLYQTCMNRTEIERQGLEPLKKILKKLGGWPVLDNDTWDEKTFDWKESMYKLRKTGYIYSCFIDFRVQVDRKNNSRRVLQIGQPPQGALRKYLVEGMDEKIVKAYYNYMIDVATILGADRARAEKELEESLKFEIELANITLSSENLRDPNETYNPTTVKELSEKHKSVPWKKYINRLLLRTAEVDDDERVIVNVPSYLTEVLRLLQETPKRVQANYIMWRVASGSVRHLNEEIRRSQLKFSTVISGRTEREPRWKECADLIAVTLQISVGAMYVRKYFPKDAKNNAVEMVTDIKDQFTRILQKVDWMDTKTRQSALDKVASMATHIAYPDELLDDKKIEEFYGKLEFHGDDFLGKVLNLTLFSTNYALEKLRKPVNKSDWVVHGAPVMVNAFYSFVQNSIQFPAGILQGIYFHKDRPRYMNYGAIGVIIGHEITHGFDDRGRQFDKEGNLVDWWAPETKEKYLEKAECIIDQYENYIAEEVNMTLNGVNTQGENIADNGGVKAAYSAYLDWVERNRLEARLPGLNYSPRQMFWISFASTWCTKYRPEMLKIDIETEVHSPGRFRVLGSLSNMPEFARDFNCPLESEMNPEDKCSVW